MATINNDQAKPSQNNATLIYRIHEKDWLWSTHIGATCFALFQGKGDNNELMVGRFGNMVLQEDITESIVTYGSEVGQISSAGGGATTIVGRKKEGAAGVSGAGGDESPGWETNYWAGGTMYLMRPGSSDIETAEVASNTANTLTGLAGSFNGTNVNAWDGANPSEYDFFAVTKDISEDGEMTLRWKTHRNTFGRDVRRLKQFLEMAINAYATGTLTINWVVDNGAHSGSIQFDLTQGYTFLGEHYYLAHGGTVDDTTLLWQELDDITLEDELDGEAEGKFIEFELNLRTATKFSMAMLAIGYKKHTGRNWRG